MTDLDLAFAPAVDLAQMIAARTVSPVEVISNSLSRIDEVNQKLNCFCFIWHDEALEAARVATQAVARGDPLGPLHGIPVALKDTTPTAGHRTTLGSYTHEHWIPERDAYIVGALQRAGAIVVGKTATPEFAHTLLTDSPLWGVTRNPWNSSERRAAHRVEARPPSPRAACPWRREPTWEVQSAFRPPGAASSASNPDSVVSPWMACLVSST